MMMGDSWGETKSYWSPVSHMFVRVIRLTLSNPRAFNAIVLDRKIRVRNDLERWNGLKTYNAYRTRTRL